MGLLGATLLSAWVSRAVEQEPGRPAVPAAPGRVLGAASCSASVCHGGSGPRGARLSEHTSWIAHDPHARAYDILLEEPSRNIAKHLGIPAAHQEVLCLKCHAVPEYQPGAMTPRFRVEDGVGCESCHGPAERWLNEHYRSGWRDKKTPEKERLGMRDTKSLAGRAQTCARCHVGAPGMDVNHDLIAAGHPPLRFEFAAFHANLPRHWDDATDRQSVPDFDAHAWAVGQIVSAEAAFELLAERAGNAQRPWPEFAETDCNACHHKLTATSWRQGRRPPGRLPWSEWYHAMLPPLTRHQDGAGVVDALQSLRVAMAPNYPVRERVAKDAARAAHALRDYLPHLETQFARKDVFKNLATHILPSSADKDLGWPRATQIYLGLSALREEAKIRDALQALYARLREPDQFEPTPVEGDFRKLGALLSK
jgi:hypothetical protein